MLVYLGEENTHTHIFFFKTKTEMVKSPHYWLTLIFLVLFAITNSSYEMVAFETPCFVLLLLKNYRTLLPHQTNISF